MAAKNKRHRSRLSTIVIDVLAEHYDACVAFWAEALGAETPRAPRAGQRYTTLKGAVDGLIVLVQRVEKHPGVHLDIETDSVAGEVERLEAAGARRKYKVRTWWVLEDPGGNAFCVVRPQMPAQLKKQAPWPAAT
jgi:predicted enzyme related to lactoylglutathione lyase